MGYLSTPLHRCGKTVLGVLLLFALCPLTRAASLAVSITQGPQPSPTTPSTSVMIATEAAYSAEGAEEEEAQLTGTVQYRWRWQYDDVGTVVTSTPAVGEDGWSPWGPYQQASATGTFNVAGPMILTVTAEARVVDGNGAVLTPAVSGFAQAMVTSAGLCAVEVLVDGTWEQVGGTFEGTPGEGYSFRAIRWPLYSAWPSGTPEWTVDSTSSGTGSDLTITTSATVGNSKFVSVTDGSVTIAFAVTAANAYAGLGSIEYRILPDGQWYTYSPDWMFPMPDNPQWEFRIVKDNSSLPWRTGYPRWNTTYTSQSTTDSDVFGVGYPRNSAPRPLYEPIVCHWGPTLQQSCSFIIRYSDPNADLQIFADECIPVGGNYVWATCAENPYEARWDRTPCDYLDLRDIDNRSEPLDMSDPDRGVHDAYLYGVAVGITNVRVYWPWGDTRLPRPGRDQYIRSIRVAELLSLRASCGSPIATTATWPPADTGAIDNSVTRYIPAVPETPLRVDATFNGYIAQDLHVLRYSITCASDSGTVSLYSRSLYEFPYALSAISQPGTYTCAAGIDYYGLDAALGGEEMLAKVIYHAVGISSLSMECEYGGSTLLSPTTCSDQQELFLTWPDKTGASISVVVDAALTATDGQWPSSFPQWTGAGLGGGSSSVVNGKAVSGRTVTFTAPSTSTVTATCGTSKEVTLHAVQIDVDAAGVAEGDETGAGGGFEIDKDSSVAIPLTVSRSPANLAVGKVRVACSSTTSAFTLWSDASMTTSFPSANFPGTSDSVDLQLGASTPMGTALPGAIYIKPNGTSFSTTLSIIYLDGNGFEVDRDDLLIHTSN